jgi:hypothetical protein
MRAVDALQCWFDAPHGRWRILGHESHYDALVMHADAADLRDADDIARRIVDVEQHDFSEILVYVESGSSPAVRIRRVQWTRHGGFAAMEFGSEAPVER